MRSPALFMTGQTPAHFIGGGPGSARHACYISVAGRAGQSGKQMHFMGEVHMIRKTLKPDPGDGPFLLPIGLQDFHARRCLWK